MNKYMFLKSYNIDDLVRVFIKRYNLIIDFKDYKALRSNASVIRYNKRYYIFISKCLPNELLILTFLHEIMHIRTNTLNNKYTNYNLFLEQYINFRALLILRKYMKTTKFLNLFIRLFISEKELYSYFVSNLNILSEELLCLKVKQSI